MKMEKIAVLDNEIEGLLLKDILQEAQIPFNIKIISDDVLGNTFQLLKGWAYLYSYGDFAEQIKDLLADIRKSDLLFAEADLDNGENAENADLAGDFWDTEDDISKED
ncbi:MAG: hypothetical protein RR396_00825 [Clostridiales bacterium]